MKKAQFDKFKSKALGKLDSTYQRSLPCFLWASFGNHCHIICQWNPIWFHQRLYFLVLLLPLLWTSTFDKYFHRTNSHGHFFCKLKLSESNRTYNFEVYFNKKHKFGLGRRRPINRKQSEQNLKLRLHSSVERLHEFELHLLRSFTYFLKVWKMNLAIGSKDGPVLTIRWNSLLNSLLGLL